MKLFIIVLIALIFASCSKNEILDKQPNCVQVYELFDRYDHDKNYTHTDTLQPQYTGLDIYCGSDTMVFHNYIPKLFPCPQDILFIDM